jgi:hypothetical protein
MVEQLLTGFGATKGSKPNVKCPASFVFYSFIPKLRKSAITVKVGSAIGSNRLNPRYIAAHAQRSSLPNAPFESGQFIDAYFREISISGSAT